MQLTDLYGEYDELLVGNRKSMSRSFFSGTKKDNMDRALSVIRYAFTTYLKWTKDALMESLNKELMDKLKLFPFMQYIQYPIGYDKEKDWFYLVEMLFQKGDVTFRSQTIHTYEGVLNNEKSKYPRDWFLGHDGLVRAGICLTYMISNHVMFTDANDLYSLFSTDEGYQLLKKYNLLQPCKEAFETPVDYVHFVIPKENRDEFLFRFYKYKYLKEQLNENGRKRNSSITYKLEV